ncbi:MAG: iron-sulfur cluster assembly scaffold protein [Pseudomonadota bacterium]
MPSDADLIKLYSQRILALAADLSLRERLDAPEVSVKKRAPLCGSSITVDLVTENGRITEYGQDVKACALGQAAAALVAHHVIGRDRAEIEAARDALRDLLAGRGNGPEAPFAGFEVMEAAREFTNRHASIMLALDATAEAMGQVEARNCA